MYYLLKNTDCITDKSSAWSQQKEQRLLYLVA